jgi:hypothetical protein
MDIEKQLKSLIDGITKQVIENIKADIETALTNAIAERSEKFDQLTVDAFSKVIKENLRTLDFPDQSIPLSALNFKGQKLSGDNINGGIIAGFGSTGIDDRATDCQVTIMDNNTVVENTLVVKELNVKGLTTLEGDVIVRGIIPVDSPMFKNLVTYSSNEVKASLDHSLFEDYSDILFESIKKNGLDLTTIKVDGKEVIRNGQLMPSITDSSLQTVGVLKQLQVNGESLLGESLYASKKRVGINTMDPSSALAVWDEETELQIGKRYKDTTWINTPRAQRVIVSSNNKENIICETDGSTKIDKLKIGSQTFSSSTQAPSHESTKGTVVFNANPSLGGPMGWVCLGGAKWANFGIID